MLANAKLNIPQSSMTQKNPRQIPNSKFLLFLTPKLLVTLRASILLGPGVKAVMGA